MAVLTEQLDVCSEKEDIEAYLRIDYGLINYIAASQRDSHPINVHFLPRDGA